MMWLEQFRVSNNVMIIYISTTFNFDMYYPFYGIINFSTNAGGADGGTTYGGAGSSPLGGIPTLAVWVSHVHIDPWQHNQCALDTHCTRYRGG